MAKDLRVEFVGERADIWKERAIRRENALHRLCDAVGFYLAGYIDRRALEQEARLAAELVGEREGPPSQKEEGKNVSSGSPGGVND